MAYNHPNNKFHRSRKGAMIAGVCAGLSETLKIDVTLIRIVFVVSLVLGGTGFWVYLILYGVLPLELERYHNHQTSSDDIFEAETKDLD